MINSDSPCEGNMNSKHSTATGPRSFEDEGITLKDLLCSYIMDAIDNPKPSNPTGPSSDCTGHQKHPCPVESLIQLLPAYEQHRRRDSCCHGKVCHYTRETSHCMPSDNSQGIL